MFKTQKSLQRNEFLFKFANFFNKNVCIFAHNVAMCARKKRYGDTKYPAA